MRRECRGLVYLINNEQFHTLSQRDGTKFDRDNLKKLFTDLHFEVIVENNLTAEVGHSLFLSTHCSFTGSFFWIEKMNWIRPVFLFFFILL